MPIVIACPSCKAKMKAPDDAAGKAVKCPGCGTALKVPAAATVPAPVAASAPAPSRPEPLDEPAENDPHHEEAHRRGAAVRREEDYDEPPRRTRSRSDRDDHLQEERGRGRDDDYEDEEDRPRRKRRKGSSSGDDTTDQERSDAMIFWILAIVFSPIGPVVWWLIKKQDSRFIDHQGRQWLNLTITSICLSMVLATLMVAGGFGGGFLIHWAVGLIFGGLCFLLLFAYGIYSFVITIIALLKAKDGVWYRIPRTFQLLK